jgi:hypothetical protein
MERFREPAGATRAAVAALGAYMVLLALAALLRLFDNTPGGAADIASLPAFLTLIACFFLVGRWIYLTNANAHFLSDDMTITPGWSVGWFFVPFANLVKPYEGVKQTWRASHRSGGLPEDAGSQLLPWWWGLWLVTNILSSVSVQLESGIDEPTPLGVVYLDVAIAALNVPLCLILIRLMRRLSHVQVLARQTSAFA